MGIPRRIKRQEGRHALVDGIPFPLPINAEKSPAIMAVYSVDANEAQNLLPGDELFAVRMFGRAFLVVAVMDYRITDIGEYIEFSIAIACTHGRKFGPGLLPGLLSGQPDIGQYVIDLPVSSEISVKGGKGIWGMPKHQANLDFQIGPDTVSSQYDLDGKLVAKITIDRPRSTLLPLNATAVNFCQFRGLLMKSYVHFKARMGLSIFEKRSARLVLGDHPRAQVLKKLRIGRKPIFTLFAPEIHGVLDDHLQSWFLSFATPPSDTGEGMESVVDMGLGQEWLEPPSAEVPGEDAPVISARQD